MMFNPQRTQKIAFFFLFLATLLIVIPVGLIVVIIIQKGLPAINWQFISDIPRQGMRSGGIFPAILGTIYLVLGAIIFALPIGLLAAIYLSEYAKDNFWTRIIKLSIVNLAGVPSVIYGLFGLALFVVFLKFGASILSGSLTLGIMILPIIITASREALESVPYSFREVSLSLGASKWQTIRHIVLPNAIPGILTGTILGLGRAAGETAPILFTVAAFYLPRLPKSIFDQAMALPYHLYVISTQVPNVDEKIRYGTALVLLTLVLFMNLIAIIIRYRFRKKKKW
jgi:phosphate transport system permease protein